jgi:hypothetical protein
MQGNFWCKQEFFIKNSNGMKNFGAKNSIGVKN